MAGRVAYRELPVLDALETGSDLNRLWLRGGFPDSFTARSDGASMRWRRNFICTWLERDLPQSGLRAPAETLKRFWTMLCHRQGSLSQRFGAHAQFGHLRPIGNPVCRHSGRSHAGAPPPALLRQRVGKRLIKTPRLFVHDSGIVHSLLNLGSLHDFPGHPAAGATREGVAIENFSGATPGGTYTCFYRTRSGAEIDLLLLLPGEEPWAVEIKRTRSPRVPRGFRIATADVGAARSFIVYPGTETYPLGHGVVATPLPELMKRLIARD